MTQVHISYNEMEICFFMVISSQILKVLFGAKSLILKKQNKLVIGN